MKNGTKSRFRPSLIGAAVISLLAGAMSSSATTHIIQFGGSLGFTYSPSSLSVTVGDTIEWTGDFTMHPLSSTTIPAGAPSWHNGTGTVFDYVVTVPGTYNYQCDFHFSIGMVGSFVAALAGVDNDQNSMLPASFQLHQNYPNPFNPATTIQYALPHRVHVTLVVFNTLGQQVAILVNADSDAGYHTVQFDGSELTSGVYFYRLQAGSFVETKKLLLLR